ncbi:MAG: hypothetical protein U0414_12950 [Polyangiaceae bacterium]
MRGRAWLLLLIAGTGACAAPGSDGAPSGSAPPRTTILLNAAPTSAGTSSGVARDVSSAAPITASLSGAPAAAAPPAPWWPADTKEITLSWVMHPPVDIPGAGYMGELVEVVAAAGSARRSVPIEVQATIMFYMESQSDCDPQRRKTRSPSIVTELFMNGTGNFLGTVERTATGVDVYSNESADGLCDDSPARRPCPVHRKLLGSIPLPDGVPIWVRFVRVEKKGGPGPGFREVPLSCGLGEKPAATRLRAR